ncbi:hypothetical protein [Legionella shakespearei]|uniref:Uncharacterized protein n=1 Tax=Legionella shakespearei DSM 23087 TaxID=1122169 RepID=A0A0W0YQQ9_9GAMM|nr:hypothetical protein [Legionella shakespearei]KTD59205.1 hypothetical protein Lsha_1901 [Legionella shakespearei DSM 23087]
MQIFLTGGDGTRIKSVYVDRDDEKKTFTAVITDAKSNFGVDDIATKYPSLDITSIRNEASEDNKKPSYTIMVKVQLSNGSDSAKREMSTFFSALGKLNNESHNTCFYLREVEFFTRQAKIMENKLFGQVTGTKSHQVNSHEFNPGNAAF